MASREQMFLSFLHSPAVTLYSDAQRVQAYAVERTKRYPDPYLPPFVIPRTPEEREAILAKLARRAARQDYLRTDPWAGIDVNPWRITEEERKRFGLGRFR